MGFVCTRGDINGGSGREGLRQRGGGLQPPIPLTTPRSAANLLCKQPNSFIKVFFFDNEKFLLKVIPMMKSLFLYVTEP